MSETNKKVVEPLNSEEYAMVDHEAIARGEATLLNENEQVKIDKNGKTNVQAPNREDVEI